MAERTGPWSLRSRVALAAGLGAVIVAVVAGAVVGTLLSHREIVGLDRRLEAVVSVAQTRLSDGSDPAELLGPGRRGLLPATVNGLVVTVRSGTSTSTAGLTTRPPTLPPTDGDATVGGTHYRVRSAALPDGGTVTVGLPATATDRTVARVRTVTVLVTALGALAAAGLGWLLAGPATRPLRELRDRTALLGGRPGPADRIALTAGSVASTVETAEVADALAGLLQRIELAGAERERALHSARDFAAAAEHELRTPLTAMRTDLEVLTAHPELPAAERAEVLAQLVERQQRVEDTLAALARLATGDLAVPDRSPVELTDLLAHAVRHAGAHRIEVAVRPEGDRVLVTVDDDGAGVPRDERTAVFDRFRRGRGAHGPGSGLGLALVAQQAALHDGTATLTDSPLGGTRAVLDLPL